MGTADSDSLDHHQLSDMRRGMLRILDRLDGGDPIERSSDLAARIRRLTEVGRIPESMADLMHMLRRFRNRAEYRDELPAGLTARSIYFAWEAIKGWADASSAPLPTHVRLEPGRAESPL